MEDSVDGAGIRSEVECLRPERRFSYHLNIPQLLSIYQKEEIFLTYIIRICLLLEKFSYSSRTQSLPPHFFQ